MTDINKQTLETSVDVKKSETSDVTSESTQPQQTITETVKKNEEVKVDERATKASSNNYESDKFMNVQLSLIDEGEDVRTNFNFSHDMKIVCFFAPKIFKAQELYHPDEVVKIPYSIVKELVMVDRLDNIGMSGYVTINNDGNALGQLFERHNNYYFVVNITEYTDFGSIKYEPYIFDVASIENITNSFKGDKVVKIHLVDIITSILSSHSIASFIKFEGTGVTKCKTYKELFRRIINYVKRYIRINNNNEYEFKKDILFEEDILFEGTKKLNGNDQNQDYSHLVTASFNKVDRNASIYEALKVFLKDCVTSISMTDEIKDIFENIGDVLIPFFFKEEYADQIGLYYQLWNKGIGNKGTDINDTKIEIQESSSKVNNDVELTLKRYGGKANCLALRHITMRDFFMPFYLCFSYDKDGGPFLWEDINPVDFKMTLNGSCYESLQSLTFNAIDKRLVDKIWKNAVFLDGSVESGACKSTLVFFDWFYKFFLVAFLNSNIVINSQNVGGKNNYISNVIPDFYAFAGANKIGYADNANDKTFNNMFDEYNAYTVVLTTKDTLNESLRAMGKNLASLVLANDAYTFSLKGNILRRPNEIVRLSSYNLFKGGERQLNAFTGDSTLYVYIRQVTHVFKGTSYTNNIVASKICEQI